MCNWVWERARNAQVPKTEKGLKIPGWAGALVMWLLWGRGAGGSH